MSMEKGSGLLGVSDITRQGPRKRYIRFVVAIIIGTAVIFLLLFFAGFSVVVQALVEARKDYLFLALLMTVLTLVVRSVRWGFYLRKVGCETKFTLVFSTLLAGCFIENVTPARIGEFFRPLILRFKDNVAVFLTLPTVLVERILDLGVSSFVALLGVVVLLSHLQSSVRFTMVIGILIMLILIGLVLYLPRILALILRLGVRGLKALRIMSHEDLEDELLKAVDSTRLSVHALLRDKDVTLIGLTFTFVIWLLNGFRLYLVLKSLGLEISLLQATVVVVFTILVATTSMIPFGHGSAEFAMAFILTSLGYPFELSTAAAVIDKFLAVWFVVLVGAVAGSGLAYSKSVSKEDTRFQ